MRTIEVPGVQRRPGTIVYIDGFNLYYGAVKGTPHKWLDFEELSRLLLPHDHIVKIRYFTARVSARPNDPQQANRQDTYLRTLATLPLLEIHYGHFVTRPVRLPLAQPEPDGPALSKYSGPKKRALTSIWPPSFCWMRSRATATRRSWSATTRIWHKPS